jgi:hypothetical protein
VSPLVAAIVALVEAMITIEPTVATEIEARLARLKSTSTAPLVPQVTADTAAIEAELEGK